MRNKLFFFWFRPFFLGGFLSRSRWLDHVMSSTSKKGPKFWSDVELASKKAVRKWWGLIFWHRFTIYFWGGFGASSILFPRFFDETMKQISTNSHIICRYIVSTAYRLVHCLKTADQVHPRNTNGWIPKINDAIFEAGDTFSQKNPSFLVSMCRIWGCISFSTRWTLRLRGHNRLKGLETSVDENVVAMQCLAASYWQKSISA